jgi:hypothetical protein
MSSEKTRTSDRFQIITAVLFMGLFAALFLIIALPENSMTSFVCSNMGGSTLFTQMCSNRTSPAPKGPGQFIPSRINLACVDEQGLKISIQFDQPLTGAAAIQVFSTGPDFFPSEQGMTDSYEISQTLTAAVDQLDLVIPVDAMPVGEQIFGNIFISDEDVSSFVAYSMLVSDCSTTSVLPPGSTPSETPTINNATCLPSRQMMIAFEFEQLVLGQYRAFVADIPYQLSSVVSQPSMLFFSGEPPPEGPIVISLVSATDGVTVFEETYTPPVCGAT